MKTNLIMSIVLLGLSILNIVSITYNPWKDTAKKCTDGLEFCTELNRKAVKMGKSCVDSLTSCTDKLEAARLEAASKNTSYGMDLISTITTGDYSVCLGVDSKNCNQEDEDCYCPEEKR